MLKKKKSKDILYYYNNIFCVIMTLSDFKRQKVITIAVMTTVNTVRTKIIIIICIIQ